jgi:hypothetical protein
VLRRNRDRVCRRRGVEEEQGLRVCRRQGAEGEQGLRVCHRQGAEEEIWAVERRK